MSLSDLSIQDSEAAFSELISTLDGIDEARSWGRPAENGFDHLNTDGSIQGVVLHVASGKFAYGSIGFRNAELRWQDIADRIEALEPDWNKVVEFLHEAQAYWSSCLSQLTDDCWNSERPHFSGALWPTWKLVKTVTHHDLYHAGQIGLLRCIVHPSTEPPPSYALDIRTYCSELPHW